MIILQRPNFSQDEVLNACIAEIYDLAARARCGEASDLLAEHESKYAEMAMASQLYMAPIHARGGDDIAVLLRATRGDMKGLYSNQMSRSGKAARKYYDKIKMSTAHGICPYCGIGTVETLDHFLPKGRYSIYSILPFNLVPACRDCNTEKKAEIFGEDDVPSHPYFEDARVSTEAWLQAEVVDGEEPFARFYFSQPISWPDELADRVRNHMEAFGLARRYSVQAASRYSYYAGMIDRVLSGGSAANVLPLIEMCAESETGAHGINSWQSALARAISQSEFFLQTGYRHFVR
ncbi:HNH endonuclease signature motif containing protein [Stenotrophomonas sp. VV52]|uniref:HNH endonuclease n=1 Tax=Stenotrophomonas sp. VV52 TaxID=2066958 RepID=UPI000C9E9ABA|nr:HNH endonuclease signature motif containing protein [Stenotrophomonas sp. VV52]